MNTSNDTKIASSVPESSARSVASTTTRQVTLCEKQIYDLLDELYKVRALAHSIHSLVDSYGSLPNPSGDGFVDDDVMPLLRLVKDMTIMCESKVSKFL